MKSELSRRIVFTIGALLVYRLGSHIPLPGLDPAALADLVGSQPDSLLAMTAGSGMERISLFSLSIIPFVSVAVLLQIASLFVSRLRALSAGGWAGRDRLARITLLLTLAMAAFQSFGIATALQDIPGLVPAPGMAFVVSTVATLTGATAFLVWLSGQITLRGIGNGVAVIIAATAVSAFAPAAAGLLDLGRTGVFSTAQVLGFAAIAIGFVALIVFVEGARLDLRIDFSGREIGGRALAGRSVDMPVKLNSAGVLIPTLVAGWLMAIPGVIAIVVTGAAHDGSWYSQGSPLYLIASALLIVLCALVYTAILLNPDRSAQELARHKGTIRGVAPGEPTADYLNFVLSRIALIGAIYLAAIIVVPEWISSRFSIPVLLGGASFVVVVGTMLDILEQARRTVGQMPEQTGGYA